MLIANLLDMTRLERANESLKGSSTPTLARNQRFGQCYRDNYSYRDSYFPLTNSLAERADPLSYSG